MGWVPLFEASAGYMACGLPLLPLNRRFFNLSLEAVDRTDRLAPEEGKFHLRAFRSLLENAILLVFSKNTEFTFHNLNAHWMCLNGSSGGI